MNVSTERYVDGFCKGCGMFSFIDSTVSMCHVCCSRTSQPTPVNFVYFIQSIISNEVKIGYSNDVARRLYELENSERCGMILLGTVEGGRELEQTLHKQFHEYQLHGEWFNYAPVIRDWVNENAKSYPGREFTGAAKPRWFLVVDEGAA